MKRHDTPTMSLKAVVGLGYLLGLTVSAAAQTPFITPFEGEWIFVEDRTPGRALERVNPPMSSKFAMKIENNVLTLVSGHGSGQRDTKITLNGSHTDVPGATPGASARYRATLLDGVLAYEVEFVRTEGGAPQNKIRREFRFTGEGLEVRSNLMLDEGVWSVALYKRPQDIALPVGAKATISQMGWLSGNWSGSRGANGAILMEERWSPAKGGSMLAISRTVSRERLSAFEYLRIVERDGTLVYIAQPNGLSPTEFILTELSGTRAVFENPRHDFPKKIVYELSPDGVLSTYVGYLKGGNPRRYDYRKEGTSN